jgi:hypothetical protein
VSAYYDGAKARWGRNRGSKARSLASPTWNKKLLEMNNPKAQYGVNLAYVQVINNSRSPSPLLRRYRGLNIRSSSASLQGRGALVYLWPFFLQSYITLSKTPFSKVFFVSELAEPKMKGMHEPRPLILLLCLSQLLAINFAYLLIPVAGTSIKCNYY